MTYFLSFSYFPVFYWGCLLKWLQAMKEIIGVYQTVFSVHVNTVFSWYKTSVAIQWLEQWFRSHTTFLKNLSFIQRLTQTRRTVNDINFITACHTICNSIARQWAWIRTAQVNTILHFLSCSVSYFSKPFKLATKGFW